MARRAQAKTHGRTDKRPLVDVSGNSRAIRTTLDEDGRVVIPAEFREALGMHHNEDILIRLLDGEVRIYTFAHATQQVQEWGAGLAPPERILSEELIAERRAEAARE